MSYHRLKSSFTAGEISPDTFCRVDFDRYKNGCKRLYNAVCLAQGPATNRPGTEFIFDLTTLNPSTTNPAFRLIPFIFSETQSYVLIFFRNDDDVIQLVFGTADGLLVFSDTPPTECPDGTAVDPAYTAGDIIAIDMPTGWDIDNFDWAQSADEIYFAQSGLEPHILKRYSNECWQLVDATTAMTDMPADWTDDYGWPERVVFHQQRIVFAANILRGNTVWLSRAGDFTHFGQADTNIVDADAVTFTLASGTQNKIQWLASGKSLYIGTAGDEWTVQGSTQPALTPSNILAVRQTNNGSEPLKPILVGQSTLFLERFGRRINEFVYDYTLDSYKTSDLSIVSTHVTDQYSIIDMAFQQTPDNIVWGVREDGDLLGLTYQREHKVVGWHHHSTDGEFMRIACIPGDTREDDVFAVVKREIDGDDKYYFEVFADRFMAETAEYSRFLDSHLVFNTTATDTVTGLDHLEGKEVGILVDGLVHPPRTVSSGEITLDAEYTHIVVGLPYTSIIWPLLEDVATAAEGTSLSRSQRISNLSVNLFKTLGCVMGRNDVEDGETTELIPFRNAADAYIEQIPLFTGWFKVGYLEGFGLESDYFFMQTLPLPMTIRAIVDTVEVFD
jgi:hypothetical protein